MGHWSRPGSLRHSGSRLPSCCLLSFSGVSTCTRIFLWTLLSARCSFVGSPDQRRFSPKHKPLNLPSALNARRAWSTSASPFRVFWFSHAVASLCFVIPPPSRPQGTSSNVLCRFLASSDVMMGAVVSLTLAISSLSADVLSCLTQGHRPNLIFINLHLIHCPAAR